MIKVDFSDMEHGLGVLFAAESVQERQAVAEVFANDLATLPPSSALADFCQLLAPILLFGDAPLPAMREAFTQLVIVHSGAQAAQYIKQEQKKVSVEHGKQGGAYKPNVNRDEAMMEKIREITKRDKEMPLIEAARILINSGWFELEDYKPVSIKSICRIIRENT